MQLDALKIVAALARGDYETFPNAVCEVLSMLETSLPGSAVFVSLFDRDADTWTLVDAQGDESFGLGEGTQLPLDDAFCSAMASGRGPRLSGDVPSDPVYGPMEEAGGFGVQSYVGVPVRLAGGEPVGSVCAIDRRRTQFSPSDLELLQLIGELLGRELARRLDEEALRRHSHNITAVARAAREIVVSEEARSAICRAALEVGGASFAAIVEPVRDALMVTASTDEEIAGQATSNDPNESFSARAMADGVRRFCADAHEASEMDRSLLERTNCVSLNAEPIVRDDEEVIGVLVVGWPERVAAISSPAVAAIGLLAVEAAIAIGRADATRALQILARSDALTGLPNRRAWDERLGDQFAFSRRNGQPVSVVLLDLDDFKGYNDRLGHQAGDELLKGAATAWSEALRDTDMLSRWGGDEFGVVLAECDLEGAERVVRRMREVAPNGQQVSAGVVQWNGESSPEELVGDADRLLYEDKRARRGPEALRLRH